MIFIKTLKNVLKQGLTLKIMNSIDHYPKEKKQKSNWFNERYIMRKNNEKICWIKSKNLQLFNR